MSVLLRSRAGIGAGAFVARRPLLQPVPVLRHRVINLSTISRTRPSPTPAAQPTHIQLSTVRRTFTNRPYVSQTIDDDLDDKPAKLKPKGRWILVLIFLANLSMFGLIYKCRAHLGLIRKTDEETRVAQKVAQLEANGYEMTPERMRIIKKWDKGAIEICNEILTRCATSLDQILKEDYASFFLSPISHMDVTHLAVNMISLFFLGRAWLAAHPSVGFARIAFGAAAAGNLGHYASSYLHGKPDQRGLGASGMTSGIAGALLTTVPFRNIYDLAIMVGIQWAIDGYSVVNPQSGDRIGHGAHLGGAAFGLLYGLLLKRRLR